MKLRRLKPGSLTATGAVVDYQGVYQDTGPCWIPRDFGVSRLRSSSGRLSALDHARWRLVRDVTTWPSMKPSDAVICVVRVEPGQ